MNLSSFEAFTSTLWQISKNIQKLKNREMSKLGLKGAHTMCLFYLKQRSGGLTAAELSELCDLDKGAVSRTLEELEAKEYVSCPEPQNRRRYRTKVFLTDAGRQITEHINLVIDEIVSKVSRGLSEAEKAVMYKALSNISDNLQDEIN